MNVGQRVTLRSGHTGVITEVYKGGARFASSTGAVFTVLEEEIDGMVPVPPKGYGITYNVKAKTFKLHMPCYVPVMRKVVHIPASFLERGRTSARLDHSSAQHD